MPGWPTSAPCRLAATHRTHPHGPPAGPPRPTRDPFPNRFAGWPLEWPSGVYAPVVTFSPSRAAPGITPSAGGSSGPPGPLSAPEAAGADSPSLRPNL